MKTIAVIGAGVTGVTTAFVLRELGYKVTVFEKQRYPSIVTSYANGGQLSASNAEVWNHFGTILGSFLNRFGVFVVSMLFVLFFGFCVIICSFETFS